MMDKQDHARYIEAISHFEKREYKKALELIDQILKLNPTLAEANGAKASILIDSWERTPETNSQIKQAIAHLKKAIESKPNVGGYHYNLGNAWYVLAISDFEKSNRKYTVEIFEEFESAKKCFRTALNLGENYPQTWINLGNVLDYLGRYLEALECYDKAILLNPRYYNAWGNRGIACRSLALKCQDKCTKNCLAKNGTIHLGIELSLFPDFKIDQKTKDNVRDLLSKNNVSIDLDSYLVDFIPQKRVLLDQKFSYPHKNNEDFKSFYVNFCEQNQLFLNLLFDCKDHKCINKDLINIKFHTLVNDNRRAYEISTRWQSLIDNFKTARFYLALAQFKHPDFDFSDKVRDDSDYSMNYLANVEMLKNSFLISMSIFDKIAFFLNEYENLDIEDGKVAFWGSNSIFTVKKSLINDNNWQIDLMALAGIKNELDTGDFKRLLEVRHYLTHRYFVLHDPDVKSAEHQLKDNDQYHMEVDEFFNRTIFTLRIVRNALFSLSFFVASKESKIAGYPSTPPKNS
jgi:tetratricopeptide (TPR) repeat protein